MGLFDGSARLFSSFPKGTKTRPPFEASYLYILAVFAGFLIADLSVLYVRPAMLPTQPPPRKPIRAPRNVITDASQYSQVSERNIFNQDGKIPPPLTSEGGEGAPVDNEPVLSQLPLSLEGTLVHANPARSVASIMLKTKNETHALSPEQEIEGLARVVRIERRKVIIRNMNNNRLEFIEIPKDTAVTFGVKDPAVPVRGEEVLRKGEFDFTMKRTDITKYTADLGGILQQARMVPNIVPGSGGQVEGFRFVAIEPNSIYEKLGFKPMDVIKSVNGEAVNSPTKAMELYNALKSEGRINLTVERNGRNETFTYNIAD
ncbi:MAG: type II secretion system protein GspC [Bdellovibrionales bacterium]